MLNITSKPQHLSVNQGLHGQGIGFRVYGLGYGLALRIEALGSGDVSKMPDISLLNSFEASPFWWLSGVHIENPVRFEWVLLLAQILLSLIACC